MLEALGALVKEAAIGRLEVVNISVHPEVARELGVRSVPWARVGDFTLAGLRSLTELREWAARAGSEVGLVAYFDEALREGRRAEVEALVRAEPVRAAALAMLLVDPETGIQSRLGAMATLEELRGTGRLAAAVPRLAEATGSPQPRIRVDALHALSLTASPAAAEAIRARLSDPDAEVREAAREALASLAPARPGEGRGP
jgi:hypothetical protein